MAHHWKKGEKRRILVVDAGYFLIREIIQALRKEGHQVRTIPFRMSTDTPDPDPVQFAAFLHSIKEAEQHFQPHALLTVNHLGFDGAGELTGLLERLKLPALVWYVDSPRYIFLNYTSNISQNIGIFLWDQSYEPWMRQIGFDKVDTLPLATDPDVFNAEKIRRELLDISGLSGDSHPEMPLVFVGDSMNAAVVKAFAKLPSTAWSSDSDSMEKRMEKLAASFYSAINAREAFKTKKLAWDIFPDILETNNNEKIPLENMETQARKLSEIDLLNLESALVLSATWWQRATFIKTLNEFLPFGNLHIFGDEGWRRILNGSVVIQQPVDYYRKLPSVYNRAGAIINLTSFQMPTALNQRCYDVPASGGFLLTDAQAVLPEHFEPEVEMVAFSSPQECLDKWNYYRRNENQRRNIVEKSKKRVLSEHTYQHRIRRLLHSAEIWFA